MVLYRTGAKISPKIERARQTLNISIDEPPERPKFLDRSARERRKYIATLEKLVRSSREYKEYVKYLKTHFDMTHCEVLPAVTTGNGKKYSIDIHHEPFQLSWITDTVLHKRQDLGESLDPFLTADEIMELHYRGLVGLIPLSKTVHELVHSDRIMIPLNYVYQDYHKFADEYDPWIPEYVVDLIRLKAELTMKSNMIQSDVIVDPVVTYLDVEGQLFPEVPAEWEHALARQRVIEGGTEESDVPTAEEMKTGGIE